MLTTLLAAAAVSAIAATATSPVKPADPTVAKALGDASADFTVDLLKILKSDKGNTFFSPYSIQTAMWMAGSGANGKTKEEIRKALHLPGDAAASDGFAAVDKLIRDAGNAEKPKWAPEGWLPPTLRSANRLWHSGGFEIHKSYKTTLEQTFSAQAEELNFAKPAKAAKAINSWISNITAKRITDLVSENDIPQRGLVLTNAVYFKGRWAEKLYPLKTVEFTTRDGRAIKPEGMTDDHSFEYQQFKGGAAVRMHYQGDASMTIILPEPGKFDSVLEKLDLKTIAPKQVGRKIIVTMPKFKTGQQSSISGTLQKLGVTTAFDPDAADFEGITASKPTYISNVIHAANIDVDENGTEAAAATAVVMTTGAAVGPSTEPIRFTVDRPFIFYISNTTSGTVLFAGIINDPAGGKR